MLVEDEKIDKKEKLLSLVKNAIYKAKIYPKWNKVHFPGKYKKFLNNISDEHLNDLKNNNYVDNRLFHFFKRKYINKKKFLSHPYELDIYFNKLLDDKNALVYYFSFNRIIRINITNFLLFGILEIDGTRVSLIFPDNSLAVFECLKRWNSKFLGKLECFLEV